MPLSFTEPWTKWPDGYRCGAIDGTRTVQFHLSKEIAKRHVIEPKLRDPMAKNLITFYACMVAYQRVEQQPAGVAGSLFVKLIDADFEDQNIIKIKAIYDEGH